MKKISLRNGDWTFTPTKDEVKGKEVKHNGSFIFATGEATNHHHVITVPKEEDMTLVKMPDGSFLVKFEKDAVISHPEHSMKNDLIVPAGTYRLNQRREKDWFSLTTRKIID